jgi:hypothetical protein
MKKQELFNELFTSFAVFPAAAKAKAGFAFFTVIFSGLLTSTAYTQEKNFSETIISISEDLANEESDPEAVNTYMEQLQELSDNPVNINSADESEISRLFFLSDFQVKVLADYVNSSGKIVSLFEIAAIPGFDRHTTEMIAPFIDLSTGQSASQDSIRFRSTLLINFIVKPGETDTSLAGPSYKILSKYKFISGRVSGGFTTEKDPGEKFFYGNPPQPDFLSGYLSYSGKGILKKIIIGDFSAKCGQGTNINTGIRTGLSLIAPGYMAARNEIRPYTSTDENSFFRGAAAQISFNRAGILLFISHKRIDATISANPDSTSFVESFYKTGLHNTPSLIIKKDAVSETTYGMNISYRFRYLKAGICFSENRFSLPVRPEISEPEKLYDFKGNSSSVISVYYNSLVNRMLLYGEFSMNDFHRYAMVQGVTLRPADRLTFNFLFRNYTPGYTSFHGNGMGTSSSNSNEQALLGNFTFEAAKHLFVSAGCDISHYPWLKYRCSYPSMARRTEIKLKYLPLKNLALDLSYNIRYALLDSDKGSGIAGIEETESRTIKGQVKYGLTEGLSLQTRIDYKVADPSGSKGILLLQDIVCSFRSIPLTLWFRYCIFNTDDWNSRLFTYENDLIYSFSIPALSGKGTRSYIMAKWEIGNLAEIRVKYSLTSLISENNVNEEKDELKFQIRLWF